MIDGHASGHLGHTLSRSQVASIRAAMRLFIEDDIVHGRPRNQRRYCDACEQSRPAAGFIHYGDHRHYSDHRAGDYAICNACATSYELARARGLAVSIGQYVLARGSARESLPVL